MRVHFLAFKSDLTTLFEQTLSFVWAIHNLLGAVIIDMTLNLAFFNLYATLVLASNYCFWAFLRNMLFNLVERKTRPALQQTFNHPEGTLF
jgi:hypothetical protein